MNFTKIRDLRYSKLDKSRIDLFVTCEKYGEIPITLNIVNTEDIHTFVKEDGSKIGLKEYCLSQEIKKYEENILSEQEQQEIFREERNNLLQKADIEINKAIDNADIEREKRLRIYRQELRDSTINWVLPQNIL